MITRILTTRLLQVGPDPFNDPAVEEASVLLKQGQIVGMPTETVYGLACDAANRNAIEKVFKAKQRPADNPLIVHLAELEQVHRFCHHLDERLERLAQAFWPGPLTLVLGAKKALADTVGRGLGTLAVRIPRHPVARALLERSKLALAAPSANLSGKPSPTEAAHVFHDLKGRLPLILDAGPCKFGIESTVLDISSRETTLLRPGSIARDALERVLGIPIQQTTRNDLAKRSPGTRYRHYAPEAPTFAVGHGVSQSEFNRLLQRLLQRFSGQIGYIGQRQVPNLPGRLLHIEQAPNTLARYFYGHLRALDQQPVDAIIVDGVPEIGEGASLSDRLRKAATFFFEDQTELPF